MKQLITFLTIVLCLVAKAQITFPAPGATWHYLQATGGFGPPYGENNETVQHVSDTIILGHPAKGLSPVHYFMTNCFPAGRTFFYSSNDSVFFYNSKTLNQWQLLYSFNTPVGQSWQFRLQDYSGIDTIEVKVDSVKNTLINSVSLKTLYVSYTEFLGSGKNGVYGHSVIYDRIGDIKYILDVQSADQATEDPCYMPYFLCYSDSLLGMYQADSGMACNYSNPAGIEQFTGNNGQVTIWPNPASTNLQVAVSSGQIAGVRMYDVLGNGISAGHVELVETSAQLDVSNLTNGVYFIEIMTKEGSYTKKIVIQH